MNDVNEQTVKESAHASWALAETGLPVNAEALWAASAVSNSRIHWDETRIEGTVTVAGASFVGPLAKVRSVNVSFVEVGTPQYGVPTSLQVVLDAETAGRLRTENTRTQWVDRDAVKSAVQEGSSKVVKVTLKCGLQFAAGADAFERWIAG